MKNRDFRVLFINCNTMMDVLLPVGLSLISACLKEEGFGVKLFDTTFYKTATETGDEARAKTLQVRKTDREEFGLVYKDTDMFNDLKKLVEEYQPDIIGFSTETRENIFETIEFNRKLNVPGVMVSLYNPYKGTALREYCDEEGLMQKGSHAGDYRSEIVLNMPQLSREDLLELQRTFPLYVRFPKSEWPRIKKCEGNGQEAEALYNELSREYTEKYL